LFPSLFQVRDVDCMLNVCPVTEIETSDIHTRINESEHLFVRGDRGADSADYFGSIKHKSPENS
jgi:hypothetical protein